LVSYINGRCYGTIECEYLDLKKMK